MDNLTKEQRKYNMSRIRSTGTKLELKFFKLLEDNKLSFLKYPKKYGRPDCQIGNTLVFMDSDFWHGWHFNKWRDRLPRKYWVQKIGRNIKRDNKKFRLLRLKGYKVVRVWQHELRNPNRIISKLQKVSSL